MHHANEEQDNLLSYQLQWIFLNKKKKTKICKTSNI